MSRRSLRVRPAILGPAAAILALTALLALPGAGDRDDDGVDPAESASARYRALLDRLGMSPRAPEADSAAAADTVVVPRLARDLFHPVAPDAAPSGPPATVPVVPVVPSGEPRPSRRVSGILVDGPARHAVIDDLVVAEGDTLPDAWVVRITTDGVLLFSDDRFELLTPTEDR